MDEEGDGGSSVAATATAPGAHLPAGSSLMPFGQAVSFLLSQLGYAVTRRFKADLEELSLEPRHFGLLRAVNASDGSSQQALGDLLQIPASSVVALLDQLEEKGLVRRGVDPSDRRVRLVELTGAGQVTLAKATGVALRIENSLCSGLATDERAALLAVLQRVANTMGLTRGAHPASADPDHGTGTGEDLAGLAP